MAEQKGRTLYFDLLRIIAVLAVIVLHVAAQFAEDIDVYGASWLTLIIYDSPVRFGVPVFVMISGALLLDGSREKTIKELYSKNILRIFTALVFWSALYAVYGLITYKYGLATTVSRFVLGHYHLWYLYMLLGLYIMIPLFRAIVAKAELTKYFLTLSLIFAMIVPFVGHFIPAVSESLSATYNSLVAKLDVHAVMGYAFYFALGYWLSKKEISKKEEVWAYVLGLGGLAITLFGTVFESRYTGSFTGYYFKNMTPNVMLEAVAVFVLVKNHALKRELSDAKKKRLKSLSDMTFGVYLVHVLLLEILNDWFNVNTLSINPWISVPAFTIGIAIVSFAISWLLNRSKFLKRFIV